MKIAFILGSFPGLSETFILNQITGLMESGYEVNIFAGNNPIEEKLHSDVIKYNLLEKTRYFSYNPRRIIQIFRLFSNIHGLLFRRGSKRNTYSSSESDAHSSESKTYSKNSIFFKIFKKIRFIFESKNLNRAFVAHGNTFHIIHAHYGPNGNLAVNLKETGVFNGKIITSFHGYDANSYPNYYGNDVYDKLFKKGDFFTSNTNFTKEQVKKLGCPDNKICVLPVGLKIEKYKFLERTIKSEEQLKLLTVGRLVEKKGHEYAIRAMRILVKVRKKDVKYLIVGNGPLKNKLIDLVEKLDLKENVDFLGHVTDKKLYELYNSSHIFLLPSVTAKNGDKEGQGLVIQEAQAAGLPVISTLHNGIPEGVKIGKSAFLVPEKNVVALSDKINYLIENPNELVKMGKIGRKFVAEKYDAKKLNKKLIQIYEKVLEIPI